ncbi:MAG TPA: M20/M25/M40 family metallo-hydrolase [Thermoanaerobaculia bacterium]|nr:M20/M25/M40 family metallo-hydrolase [Thermoanaerobaculia bacterium]
MNRLALCLALSLAVLPAFAQDDVVARIAGAAMTQGGASAYLEKLTDTVGARVTGSPPLRAASEMILAALKDAGYTNAHLEEYDLASRWQRGPASGRVLAPIERALVVGSYGWAPGTAGEVSGALVDLGAPTTSDVALPPRVRGAAVLVDPQKVGADPSFVMRAALAKKLAGAGAAAMLIPSDKPDRMVYTSAFGFYPRAPLPVVSVAKEDSALLRRLLAKGPVTIALDVRNAFDVAPYRERNVIADLPGGTLPDEVVLVGAHYDSWDFAQGADDDGSGVAAVLDAARILKALKVVPRRTIRFAFFSGEEEACLGSRAYVAAHEKELDRLKTVLIMDEGAQAPRGFAIQGRTDLDAAAKARLAAVAALGAGGVSLDASFDQDHAPFVAAGVPAFTLWVDAGDYDTRHHAAIDTFENVNLHWLAVDAAVMGAAAWSFADAPEPVGRRLSEAEAEALMEKTGVEGTHRMVYGASTR